MTVNISVIERTTLKAVVMILDLGFMTQVHQAIQEIVLN